MPSRCGDSMLDSFCAGESTKGLPMTSRRLPAPWQVEQISGGYKVLDANGQALAYIYARDTKTQADIAKVLTLDEARRIAVNVTRLPEPLRTAYDLSGLAGPGLGMHFFSVSL